MKIYWHGQRKNIIGQNVRKLRLERKLTQKQLAESLQLAGYEFDRLTVLRIESGDRFVPDYEAKALTQVLDVSLDELFYNTAKPKS